MNCKGNEERLLLQAHGQLGLLGQILLVPHLLVCADCRKTLSGFQAASLLLMRASAVPGELGRRNAVTSGLGISGSLRTWFVALTITGLVAVSLLGWHLSHVSATAPTSSHGQAVRGCIPDLPSDRCR